MTKRPLPVTVIAILFLVAGAVGLVYHATEFKFQSPFPYDAIWILLLRLLAIICAIFILRAQNWARWLLIIWIAYHVILSGLHSTSQLVVHGILLAVVAWLLFRRSASEYFRNLKGQPVPLTPESTTK